MSQLPPDRQERLDHARRAGPFFRSTPGRVLLVSTLVLIPVTLAIPFVPFASVLGFVPPPASLLAVLVGNRIGRSAQSLQQGARFASSPTGRRSVIIALEKVRVLLDAGP